MTKTTVNKMSREDLENALSKLDAAEANTQAEATIAELRALLAESHNETKLARREVTRLESEAMKIKKTLGFEPPAPRTTLSERLKRERENNKVRVKSFDAAHLTKKYPARRGEVSAKQAVSAVVSDASDDVVEPNPATDLL